MLNSKNCHESCINTEESSRAVDEFDNSANLLALRRKEKGENKWLDWHRSVKDFKHFW